MKLIRLTLDAVINAEDITSMEVYKSSFRENTYKVSVNLRDHGAYTAGIFDNRKEAQEFMMRLVNEVNRRIEKD